MTGWKRVVGAFDAGTERDFAGTNLYTPEGKLFAFCSPFANDEPLEHAEYLLNIGVMRPETAAAALRNCPQVSLTLE